MSAGAAGGFDRRNLQAIHPLTPTQTSLLLASLYAGRRGADPGFLQLRCTLRGALDERAFETAWERVLERHDALRASVHWQATDRPVQVVFRRVRPEWTVDDWRDATDATFDERLGAFLAADRERGLDLTRAPVMRLARFRRGVDEWRLVWTCHHVLLDGWSGALVLREVARLHDALSRQEEPPRESPAVFADYIGWLRDQDESEAEAFWKTALAGIGAATTLPPIDAPPAAGGESPRRPVAALAAEETAALLRFARAQRLTAGTLVHAAWAIVLAARADTGDVCFGTTVSGRSAPVPGIEGMVGTLINALPVRVHVAWDARTADFLAALQKRLTELRRYEHTAPARIQQWSGLPGHRRVFDTLVVFENFPADAGSAAALRVEDLAGGITASVPVALVAAPGDRLELRLLHDPARLGDAAAACLLEDVRAVLSAIAGAAAAPLSSLRPSAATAGASASRTTAPPARAAAPAAAPPLDGLALQLAQIVEGVLSVHPVGPDDDFFALGGNSLNAATLFERIERVFGRRLPLATLFEASTVRSLADRLRTDGWTAPWSSLVALQPDGDRPPLFCVHSYEGNILIYRDLARRLAPDQPVYGLQSIGMDGTADPLERVEDMAARYLAEMRAVRPRGPYRLAGICFGIGVAFEIAQQLAARGEEVDRLFVLDSGFLQHLPMPAPPQGTAAHRLARRVRAHWRGLRMRAAALWQRAGETAHERTQRRVREGNVRAWTRYEPRWYPGTVTLVRSEGYHQDWHVETWSRLAASLDTHVVPGDHANLIYEPHVAHLAGLVRTLTRARVPA